MTVFRFTLIKSMKNPFTLLFTCVMPVALIFVMPLWRDGATAGFTLMLMAVWVGAFKISQGVLSDKQEGTIVRIMAAPITMLGYLWQSLLAFMVPLAAQIALISALGFWLHGWGLAFALLIALAYLVFTVSAVALGFAWSCLFKHMETSQSVFTALITFAMALSGGFVPLALLPLPLQYVGAVTPSFWAVRGLLELVEHGAFTRGYANALLWMGVIAAVCLAFGAKRGLLVKG